jgi:hypothetical protein
MSTPDANGWMTIETAPKDGRSVLIAENIGTRWCVAEGHYVRKYRQRKGTWYGVRDYGDDEFSQPYKPTHWQPLPKPPVAALSQSQSPNPPNESCRGLGGQPAGVCTAPAGANSLSSADTTSTGEP